MIYGYIRVSTDRQIVENKKFETGNYVKHNGIKIDRWIEETISGTKDLDKRLLGKLVKKIEKRLFTKSHSTPLPYSPPHSRLVHKKVGDLKGNF